MSVNGSILNSNIVIGSEKLVERIINEMIKNGGIPENTLIVAIPENIDVKDLKIRDIAKEFEKHREKQADAYQSLIWGN